MKERFGAKDPRSMMLRFHTQTGGVTLTAQQPDNNIVRVAIQTLAAVMPEAAGALQTTLGSAGKSASVSAGESPSW